MNTTVKVIVGIFIMIGVGFLGYQAVDQWHRKQMATAISNQKTECEQETARLESKISELETKLKEFEEVQAVSTPDPPKEAIATIFGEEAQAESLGSRQDDCAMISQQANALFDYFDKQGYLTDGGFSKKFMPFFKESMQLLAEKPPVLVAEMDDLYLLAKNVSHIFRTLGEKRLKVFKSIIDSESDILEPSMAVLYSWVTACRQDETASAELPQLKTLYQYSGFFLNTLGGRSYLLRRDSKVRILVNYYSVRVLDTANDEKLNETGIDIRPYLDSLFVDLSNHKGLVYRERYLSELKTLMAKYEQQ